MSNEVNAADLPFYSIFVLQKVFFSKISDYVIACDLKFGPSQSKILATPVLRMLCCLQKITKSEDVGCKAYRSNNVRRKVAYWHTL